MKTLWIAIKIFLFFTILTGVLYPLFITGVAQILFPYKANGSLIVRDNKTVGSELIGQQFDSKIYFSSRPSAVLYNPLPSGASNYGLTNIKLKKIVAERRDYFITFNMLDSLTPVPSEMIFASASGLDPHISPEAAFLQVSRIAKARNFDKIKEKEILQIIKYQTEGMQLMFPGKERVNVLILNLQLDILEGRSAY